VILRLDPDIPLVWRTPEQVQLGVERVVAVLDLPTTAHDRMLGALVVGVPDSAWAMLRAELGVTADDADAMLDAVRPALVADGREPARRVEVRGDGPLARRLAEAVASTDGRDGDGADPDLVVLVAPWVVAPADSGAWLRRDVPHLPVVAADGVVTVGPLVVPGATACLHCVALHRRDRDPSWVAVASQLVDRAPPTVDDWAALQAVALVRRAVRLPEPGAEWRLDAAAGEVSRTLRQPHPDCRCAAPPGSDWARAARASPARTR
jgi:bacteriocin biosynthesis cyclodehydratase domain-containing protein